MNRDEIHTIHAIADRAVKLYVRLGMLDKHERFALAGIAHEIMVVHREIIPLRLQEFLKARDGDFAHDIGGIHRHLDQGTMSRPAKLNDGFLPRFANVGGSA
jgi:hypothetical protein